VEGITRLNPLPCDFYLKIMRVENTIIQMGSPQ